MLTVTVVEGSTSVAEAEKRCACIREVSLRLGCLYRDRKGESQSAERAVQAEGTASVKASRWQPALEKLKGQICTPVHSDPGPHPVVNDISSPWSLCSLLQG